MKVKLIRISGAENLEPRFLRETVRAARRLNANPSWLLAVMGFETGGTFDPSIRAKGSSAVGLIQFLASTARALGTSSAKLRRMDRVTQLRFVEAYYARYGPRNLKDRRPVDTYLVTFTPAFVGKPADTVMFQNPSAQYVANVSFDREKKGYFTVGDVQKVFETGLARAGKKPPIEVEVPSLAEVSATTLLGLGSTLGLILLVEDLAKG